ncbi:Histone-lysine N-methyltransferase SETMAR, partial [Ooceraea biroi]
RPKTKVDNDHLRAVVESDPSQSTRELASIFNVSIPTILVHLAAIGKIKKLDKWVPHELTDAQQAQPKLRELELETLRHPPYSPDLSPTDYHFFRNLDNLLVGKFFNSQ